MIRVYPALVALLSLATYAQSAPQFPSDGNGLLDHCSVVVSALDSPAPIANQSEARFAESMSKFSWCVGYLQGIRSVLVHEDVSLALAGATGIKLTGPDRAKTWFMESTRVACLPDKAPVAQLARVVVKWLRDHPERLHEGSGILVLEALKDSFPCKLPAPPSPPSKPSSPQPPE